MKEKQIKAFLNAIERTLGNPIEADPDEVDTLYAEFGDGKAPAQSVFDLASKAAQKYRLEGKVVPPHVAEALRSVKKSLHAQSTDSVNAASVIDEVLRPIFGPVSEVSLAFRNRKERTENDANLLERLSNEVKRDWSEDKTK